MKTEVLVEIEVDGQYGECCNDGCDHLDDETQSYGMCRLFLIRLTERRDDLDYPTYYRCFDCKKAQIKNKQE